MSIHRLLFCCFFFSVLGNGELTGTIIRTEGGSITVECCFSFSGRRKFLCRDECKDDVLIETEGDTAQRGRYSIEYKEGTFPVSSTVLYVSITHLEKSDSGRYSCGLERPFLPDSYQEFEIRVTDAVTSFPASLKQPEQQQTEEAAHGLSFKGYILPLVVCLLFYKWVQIKNPDGLTSRKQSANGDMSRNTKFSTCRKCSAASRCADFTSTADETCSDQNKIYCNL